MNRSEASTPPLDDSLANDHELDQALFGPYEEAATEGE